MSKLLSFCLALGALLASLSAQDTAHPPAPAAESASKRALPTNLVVAVVDLDKAMEQYPRFINGRKQLRQLTTAYDDQITQARKRIDELRAAVGLLKEGSKDRALKQMDLENAMRYANDVGKLYEADIQIEDMRLQIDCYADLEVAIAQLAKDRGVHLVLRIDADKKPSPTESLNPNQVQRRMVTLDRRTVWFTADELDLTGSLIKTMQTFDWKESQKDQAKEPAKTEAPAAPNSGKDGK